MEPRLSQHQTQKLILSPQIRQYLRLLQMPVTDLVQAVENELTENPLLEERQDTPEKEASLTDDAGDQTERLTDEVRLGEDFDRIGSFGEDFDETPAMRDYSRQGAGDVQKNRDFQETLITRPAVLSDYLLWQVKFLGLTEEEEAIAEQVIGNINEQGYLQATDEELTRTSGKALAKVRKVVQEIQKLEPPGIGGRNLQEALLIQLYRQHPVNEIAVAIVRDHLKILEKRDWDQLSRVMDIPVEEIKKASEVIVRLEPRPGRSFYSDEPIAVTPDAVVTFDPDEEGKLKVEIINEKIPELRINSYYRKLLRDKSLDQKSRAFLREKLQNAMDFMRAINQRRSTLHEITLQLVKDQPEFFTRGFSHLRPLRLKDVAGSLGIHESTVSRAIQGKYIQTPQGTIPYRSFFSSKLDTVSGESESQKSIMSRIKSLIDAENPSKPLSDQAIVKILKDQGIMIARRTVAKYRDLLKILPSHLRRKR